MKASEALKIIYDQTVKTVGKDKAASAFSTTLSSIVYDISQVQEFTPEALEQALKDEAELCLKCANKNVA